MNLLEEQFQNAVDTFDKGDFRAAILSFIELYQKEYRRKQILQILNEACYLPNIEEMQKNYQRNTRMLKKYPFVFDRKIYEFEELPFCLYMVSESEFYVFDKATQHFIELYQFDSGTPFDLHTNLVDTPLFLDGECDFSHLKFLNDVVRRSEDIACDNHIYLFYNSFADLAKLLLVVSIEGLLDEQKFVFLFEEKNRFCSIDFNTQFGLDYSTLPVKEISVDEIKQIIFGWKIANVSGTSFLADIMDFHPQLLTIPDCIMNNFADFYLTQLKGRSLSQAITRLKQIPDSDRRKQAVTDLVCVQVDSLSEPLRIELNRVSSDEFLTVLEDVLSEHPNPNAREWLIGIYLAYARCHNRSFGRVVPALFVYPHDDMFYLAGIGRDQFEFYFDLIQDFTYHKIIAVIRNPVTQAGSVINFMTRGHPSARNAKGEIQLDPFYCMAFGSLLPKDYYFPLNHPLREDIGVVRFEDLKLNPEAAFASVAEFLNIPVTESMFQTTWCGMTRMGVTTENTVFDGFDTAPVYKSYDQYLSVFDKYRIELLLNKLLDVYGYKPKYYDGQRFSDHAINAMMELPFLCEEIETIVPAEQKQSSREVGMQFIKFAAAIKGFPFSVNSGTEQFAPLPWICPKEELLREPLYH